MNTYIVSSLNTPSSFQPFTIEAANFKEMRKLLGRSHKGYIVWVQNQTTARGMEMDFRIGGNSTSAFDNQPSDPWERDTPLDKRTAQWKVSNFPVM